MVISKKVLKSAVGRNRIRRRIYEDARLLSPEITEPFDLVVTVFNEQMIDLPALDLSTMLRSQLRQAGVIASTKSNPAW